MPSTLGRLPGSAGRLAAGTAERLRGTRFIGLVAEIAFFVAAGLAPLAVATLALLGAVQPLLEPGTATSIDGLVTGAIMSVFAGDVASSAFSDVQQLLNAGLAGLALPLVIGLLFSARGFTGAMRGLGHLYGQATRRPVWRDGIATLAFTLGAALLGAVGALGALLAPSGQGGMALGVFAWARWAILPGGLIVWLASLYSYSRGPRSGRWVTELPGAIVATVLIMVAGLVFGVTLRRPPTLGLGPFLGPVIGVVLATFSLVFVHAAAVVVGGALNAERESDDVPAGDPTRATARGR